MAKISKAKLLCAIVTAGTLLTACGGGGGGQTVNFNAGPTSSPTVTTTTVAGPTTTTTLSPGAVTVVNVDSLGSVQQTNVAVTFGQVFAVGDVPAGESVAATMDGATLPLQVDAKATHADGSLRHAVISAVLPQMAAGQSKGIVLSTTTAAVGTPPANALAQLLGNGFTAGVNVTIGGVAYRVAADTLLGIGTPVKWLSGPLVNEWLVSAPLRKVSDNTQHPHLSARFAIRSYAGLNKARVDVTVENNWTFVAGIQNLTYDVQIVVGGQTVYSKAALEHYHHARWRKIFWWGGEPAAHIRHSTAYLLATNAVPNYDQSLVVPESALSTLNTTWLASNTEPMGAASGNPGIVRSNFGSSGGRPDIALLPQWQVLYLLSMDRRAKAVTLGVGDQAGSWPIHYRDEATDFPVRLDNAINKDISVHPNASNSGPLPVPRCINATSYAAPCDTHNVIADAAHQPSLAYVPYLITGDYFYLEELQFWAAWNPLETGGGFRDYEKGLTNWQQIRGQAWSLRTMGQVAYITPDNHALKQYLLQQLNYSINFYNTTFYVGNPNQLGVLDGSGAGSFAGDYYIQPWQDDFFTLSVGHLTELGFTSARNLFIWKTKFPIGRMNTANTGYCWIDASTQALIIRAGLDPAGPVYSTLSAAYLDTFSNSNAFINNIRAGNGDVVTGAVGTIYAGTPYLNYACGSQAQANWRGSVLGQMSGFANSAEGTPAILGAALAVAANSTLAIPNAQSAWNQYLARGGIKPNFAAEPQWAIVPR